jgi:hypothetical protein
MSTKSKKRKNLLKGNNLLTGGVILTILITLLAILGSLLFSNNNNAPITEDQIMIQKGGSTVIVNKNGLIEYRNGDEVFYKTWDSARISYFFGRMEARAREYLNNQTGPCDGCYAVTLYVDGKLVTIYISDDEDLDETFDDFPDTGSGDEGNDDISDYFDDDNGGTTSTIVPSSIIVNIPTATPTDIVQGNEQTNYPPIKAECSSWSQDIVDKAIISNTLCTVVEE